MHNKKLPRKSNKVKCGNKETLPTSLQAAIHSAVYSGVPKQVASHIGISTKRLLNYCSDGPLDKELRSRYLLPLMQFTKNYAPLEFLAVNTGHFVFKVPLPRDPDPEKMLQNIFKLKILWEQLLVRFEKFYAAGAEDRAVLGDIAEGLFTFINAAAQLRAQAFMKLRKEKNESNRF
jgi:hypothetical protein